MLRASASSRRNMKYYAKGWVSKNKFNTDTQKQWERGRRIK